MLLILLMLCNLGMAGSATGFFNLTASVNVSAQQYQLEDKRGVPSGANPLHNR